MNTIYFFMLFLHGNGNGPPSPGNGNGLGPCGNPGNNPKCDPTVPIDENMTIMLILATILIIYTVWEFQRNAQKD